MDIGLFLFEIFLCIALILLVRYFLGKMLGPVMCRLLWGVLIIRCLVPVSVPTIESPLTGRPQIEVTLPIEEPVFVDPFHTEPDHTGLVDFPLEAAPNPLSSVGFEPRKWISFILSGIWLSGVFGILALAFFRNRWMIRQTARYPVIVPDWVQSIFLECREHLKIGAWPVLIASPCVETPCLVGAIRPRILIPEKLINRQTYNTDEVRYILLHELTHLKQGDIWFSWCWTLVLAVHWFNPILWWVGRFVSFDCEAACDHRVLGKLDSKERRSYGYSLLDILRKLNPSLIRSPGLSAVVENATNLERRLTMITHYQKRTLAQVCFGSLLFVLLLTVSMSSFAQQKPVPISPDQAKLIGYVEDFFMHNYRDVTMKKSLEWGDVTTDDNGNSTIRYKFEALIWDKKRIIQCVDFTFDNNGVYVSDKKVDGFPVDVIPEKFDTSTKEGMQKLVEKFFSRNFRDITARKTIEWGEPITDADGHQAIRYKYEATIWDKDKITSNKVFTFTKEGEYVSVIDADENFKQGEKATYLTVAEEFVKLLATGDFEKAMEDTEEVFKKKAAPKISDIWGAFTASYGKFVSVEAMKSEKVLELQRIYCKCAFEKGIVTLMVVMTPEDKVTGFFIADADKKENKKESTPSGKADNKTSQASAAAAWKHFANGKFQEGEMKFQDAVKQNPKNANAYQGLGWCQFNQGKTEEAKETFDKCLELDPKNSAALNGLGWMSYRGDDKESAISYWEKTIAVEKNASAALSGLCTVYEEREDFANAVKYYKMWLKADPQNEEVKTKLKAAEEKNK